MGACLLDLPEQSCMIIQTDENQLYINFCTPPKEREITFAESLVRDRFNNRWCSNCDLLKTHKELFDDLYNAFWNTATLNPKVCFKYLKKEEQISFQGLYRAPKFLDIGLNDLPHLVYFLKGLITEDQLLKCSYISDIVNWVFATRLIDTKDIEKTLTTIMTNRKFCPGIYSSPCKLHKHSYQAYQTAEVHTESIEWYFSLEDDKHYVMYDDTDTPMYPNVYEDGRICFNNVSVYHPKNLENAYFLSAFNGDLMFDGADYDDYNYRFGTDYEDDCSFDSVETMDTIENLLGSDLRVYNDSHFLSDNINYWNIPDDVKQILYFSGQDARELANSGVETFFGYAAIFYVLERQGSICKCLIPDFNENGEDKECFVDLKKLGLN